MFLLNKKRICIIFCCLILSILSFKVNNDFNKLDTIETVALPVNKKVIIIDAGHGRRGSVEHHQMSGIEEADINLKIALKVQNLLEQAGGTVLLTRSDENGIYDIDKKTLRQKKVSDTKNRVKIGNESEADIFVSIHLNKIPQTEYWGWQTFFKTGNEQGKKLAKSIQNGLNETIQKENKREPLKIDNVYIIKHVEIPTAIVECGFLSNEEEEKLLQQDEYQNKLAWGIYIGIMDYFLE